MYIHVYMHDLDSGKGCWYLINFNDNMTTKQYVGEKYWQL